MANVGGYGTGTTAGSYILKFNNVTLGDWVENFKTIQKRTPVQLRNNFWSKTMVMDGYYPAVTYEHEITIYNEEASKAAFISFFNAFTDYFYETAKSLKIINVSGVSDVDLVDFGSCFLQEPPALKNPDALLLHAAGMITLRFVGNTKPTVTS